MPIRSARSVASNTSRKLSRAVSGVLRRFFEPACDPRWRSAYRAEAMEPRVLLSVSASVDSGGQLTITADDNSSIAVTVSGGNVKVNAADPSSGAAAASSIKQIDLTASGTFANAIDFAQVT